jgi:hypothetical protein
MFDQFLKLINPITWFSMFTKDRDSSTKEVSAEVDEDDIDPTDDEVEDAEGEE